MPTVMDSVTKSMTSSLISERNEFLYLHSPAVCQHSNFFCLLISSSAYAALCGKMVHPKIQMLNVIKSEPIQNRRYALKGLWYSFLHCNLVQGLAFTSFFRLF